MEKFRVGTVVNFDNRNSLFGKLIGKFTSSKWTHSSIVYQHTEKYIWLAEAVSRGFKVNKYKRTTLMKRWKKSTIQLRYPKLKLQSTKYCIDRYLGIKYGVMQLAKIAILIMFKRRSKSDGLKTLICSEGVSRVLYDASHKLMNIAIEFDCDYDYVTPYMLAVSKELDTLIYSKN